MATIRQFEDLPIWQQAREICSLVHKACRTDAFKRDFELVNQISKSSGSCMDNIAEGFERDGNKEFMQFLSIAKGSIGETRSQLYRALDRGYIDQKEFEIMKELCVKESKDIASFMNYLKRSGIMGNKYKALEA